MIYLQSGNMEQLTIDLRNVIEFLQEAIIMLLELLINFIWFTVKVKFCGIGNFYVNKISYS